MTPSDQNKLMVFIGAVCLVFGSFFGYACGHMSASDDAAKRQAHRDEQRELDDKFQRLETQIERLKERK